MIELIPQLGPLVPDLITEVLSCSPVPDLEHEPSGLQPHGLGEDGLHSGGEVVQEAGGEAAVLAEVEDLEAG